MPVVIAISNEQTTLHARLIGASGRGDFSKPSLTSRRSLRARWAARFAARLGPLLARPARLATPRGPVVGKTVAVGAGLGPRSAASHAVARKTRAVGPVTGPGFPENRAVSPSIGSGFAARRGLFLQRSPRVTPRRTEGRARNAGDARNCPPGFTPCALGELGASPHLPPAL